MADSSDKENEAAPPRYRGIDDELPDAKEKKRKRKSLKKVALRTNEQQLSQQRQLIKQQNRELEKLRRAGAVDHAMQSDSDSSGDNEAVTKKGKRGNDDHGALKTDALQAGKRYAVCDELWIDPAAIRHIVYVSKSGSDTELLSDGPEEVKEQAKSILKSLPAALRPHIGTRWFRERFKEGGRSIRSSQVHVLTNLFPGYIFPDIPAKEFADRKKRPHIPEVAAKLHEHRFLYDRDPKTLKDRLNGHLRNPCILKTLQCVLHGPAVVKSGSKSSKARKVNAVLWGCTTVTIPMLAYAATVYFILSGEGEFSEQGAEHDFRHFYNTRVNLLTKESRKKGERFQELISYFNHELFPEASDGNSQDDMDDEEKELDKAIEEESEESPAEEEA